MDDVSLVIEVDGLERLMRGVFIDIQEVAMVAIEVSRAFTGGAAAVTSKDVASEFTLECVGAVGSCFGLSFTFCIPRSVQEGEIFPGIGCGLGEERGCEKRKLEYQCFHRNFSACGEGSKPVFDFGRSEHFLNC